RELGPRMVARLRRRRQHAHTAPASHHGPEQRLPGLVITHQRDDVRCDRPVIGMAAVYLPAPRPRGLALRALAPWHAGVLLQLAGAVERGGAGRGADPPRGPEPVEGAAGRAQRAPRVPARVAPQKDPPPRPPAATDPPPPPP